MLGNAPGRPGLTAAIVEDGTDGVNRPARRACCNQDHRIRRKFPKSHGGGAFGTAASLPGGAPCAMPVSLDRAPQACPSGPRRAKPTVAVVPTPGALSSVICQPKRSPSRRTIDSPMPLPPRPKMSAR